MKLYIIGNGFDRYHGIQCGYDNFQEFCKHEKNPQYHCTIVQFLDYIYPKQSEEKSIWSNFEKGLEYPDLKSIKLLAKQQQSGFSQLDSQAVQICHDIKSAISKAFKPWIDSLDKDVQSCKKTLSIDEGAYFLTFNYTKMLERIYEIKDFRVYHVHVDEKHEYEMKNEYIYGCRTFEKTSSTLQDAIAEYSELMVKPVREIIQSKKWRNWLNSLQDINDIYVLGHSLNDIDMPYFIEIAQKCSRTKWHVSYYTEEDKIRIEQQLKNLGVPYELNTIDKVLKTTPCSCCYM